MKFPAWKSWWLQYKVKGFLSFFVSVASFALVPFTGLLVLTLFRVAISFLLELLCLTFSICLSLLPAVFQISCFHHCTKPRWLSTENSDTQFLSLELCDIPSCSSGGRNRWSTVTSRKYEAEKNAYGLQKYYVLTPWVSTGIMCGFPPRTLAVDDSWAISQTQWKAFPWFQKNYHV